MAILICTNPNCPQPAKDESEFTKDVSRPNGKSARCGACSRERMRANNAIASIREANRARCRKWRETAGGKEFLKKYKESGRERAAAQKYASSEKGKKYKRHWRSTAGGMAYREQAHKTPRIRFSTARQNAQKREIYWGISFSEWVSLVAGMDCHYCGAQLGEGGSALDRKDSAGAYIPANCVPCCLDCNIAKSNRFSYEEMVAFLGPAIRVIRAAREAGR